MRLRPDLLARALIGAMAARIAGPAPERQRMASRMPAVRRASSDISALVVLTRKQPHRSFNHRRRLARRFAKAAR